MGQNDTLQNSKRYFESMNQRDRTVLLIVGVFLAVFMLTRILHFPIFPVFDFNSNGWPLPFGALRMAFPIAILAVGVGLIHKPLLKPMLWVAGILLVIAVLSSVLWPIFSFGHKVIFY